MSSKDTCIFCLEGSTQQSQQSHPLLYNVKCRCNFAFHKQCYDAYTRKTICPVCRAEVGEFFTIEELPSPYQNYQAPRQQSQPQSQGPHQQSRTLQTSCSKRIHYAIWTFIGGIIVAILLVILIKG